MWAPESTTRPSAGSRGVEFFDPADALTLVRHINSLTPADYRTITLDRSGRFNRTKVHETTGVRLTSYPGTVRQLIVTGLARDAPTVIITKDTDPPPKRSSSTTHGG